MSLKTFYVLLVIATLSALLVEVMHIDVNRPTSIMFSVIYGGTLTLVYLFLDAREIMKD